ncbi:uncharacterized protein PRCAT00006292001 [Priceomyces carsonii]|uniref:uncharacterized protein n=1 Tax=Priceomyces carsonii TaxID=28549 RepID=UPI002EDBB3EB|nr:unnamed protein product [Priceomyces carsonii]
MITGRFRMFYIIQILIFLLMTKRASCDHQEQVVIGINPSPEPKAIDKQIYSNLFTYAHLIDISYCISKLGGIEEPFKCDLSCEESFPNMTLIYQWFYDDSVCGYIATTESNIFNYTDKLSEEKKKKKTIVVSLRGTRSLFDTLADMKVEMTDYANLRYNLPCCKGCKVHKGFYDNFLHTLSNIHSILEEELKEDNYEIVFLGHSLGGSVALFLALHYLDLGYDKFTLVTMGQPLLGNKKFVDWADQALGSKKELKHDSFDRKFIRVIHKKDLITTIPANDKILNSYYQFNNQVYLNCSAATTDPLPDQVIDCFTGDNSKCIKKDFSNVFDNMYGQYYESHNTYFRKLGLCGLKIK